MKKRTLLWVLAVILLVMAGAPAKAAGEYEANKNATLTVEYRYDGAGIADAAFRLYQIATANEKLEFTAAAGCETYPIQPLTAMYDGKWQELYTTLTGLVLRDNLAPIATGKTNGNGTLAFAETFRPGLYLLLGDKVWKDGYMYTPQPAILILPMQQSDGTWNYAHTVRPKAERTESEAVTRRVLKVWEDEGYDAYRPQVIEVELLKTAEGVTSVEETVTLNEANRWRHEWTNLDARYTWTVVEKTIAVGYTTRTRTEGVTYVITNSASPCYIDPPIEKIVTGNPQSAATFRFVMEAVSSTVHANKADIPMPEGTVNGKKTVEIEGGKEYEFGNIYYMEPGTYVYRVYEENTGLPGYAYDASEYRVTCVVTEENGVLKATTTNTKGSEQAAKLVFTNVYTGPTPTPGPSDPTPTPVPTATPKPTPEPLPSTGQLWWPIPLLLVVGLALLVIGAIRRREAKDEK